MKTAQVVEGSIKPKSFRRERCSRLFVCADGSSVLRAEVRARIFFSSDVDGAYNTI